jgi:hypothetical protein
LKSANEKESIVNVIYKTKEEKVFPNEVNAERKESINIKGNVESKFESIPEGEKRSAEFQEKKSSLLAFEKPIPEGNVLTESKLNNADRTVQELGSIIFDYKMKHNLTSYAELFKLIDKNGNMALEKQVIF